MIVLRDRELEALNPMLRGMFYDRPFVGPFLVLGATDRWERTSVLKHELAHAVIAENLPGAPQWLNEGLARMLETADLDRAGHVSWGALPYLASGEQWRALALLRDVVDPRPWSAVRVGWLTYSASMLVHALDRTRPADLRCLLGAMSRGGRYDDALAACFESGTFGVGYLNETGAASGVDLGHATIVPYRRAVAMERMSDADVHAILAITNAAASSAMYAGPERGARTRRAPRPVRGALAQGACARSGAGARRERAPGAANREGRRSRRGGAHRATRRGEPRRLARLVLARAQRADAADERVAALTRARALAPRRPEIVDLGGAAPP